MSLTLIAEVLAGETWISPGGPVDAITACGLEPFLWERWVHDEAATAAEQPAEPDLELQGSAAR
jgi:hypothetical protein